MLATLPLPPAALRFMAETEEQYLAIGDGLVERIDALVELPARPRIVDIGCGYGRLAHALLRSPRFLGRYHGFDILPKQIAWCAAALTPASAGRCRFRQLDVRNDRYNPTGTVAPDQVSFELPDGSADLIVLTSVFTHMYPAEITHYLREIRRLLAPDGCAYVTFFLLDERVHQVIDAGRTHYPLPHALTPFCRVMNREDPLHVIAYETSWVLAQCAAAGLQLLPPVRTGSWSGTTPAHDFQDTLLLARAGR